MKNTASRTDLTREISLPRTRFMMPFHTGSAYPLGTVWLLLSMAVAPLVAGCSERAESATASGLSGRLELTGSSTVGPLMLEIAKRFETLHRAVRIDVQTGGSSRGVSDARRGLVDIGMASRSLKDSESDLVTHTIAVDGICLIVHRDNPISELTEQQIIDIYTGRIVNWRDAGGDDAPIVVVNKAEGRSTLELFVAHFGLESRDIDASIVIGDNQQGVKTVAGEPRAIGYVSIGAARYAASTGIPVKPLPLGDVEATTENVLNGSYPLLRQLNLVTRDPPSGLAGAFIDFAQSDQVHDLVRDFYFVAMER